MAGGAAGGSLLAQAILGIHVDDSKLSGDLGRIKSMFRSSLEGMGTVAGGILAAAGIRGIAGIVEGIGSKFITASSQIETFTNSFTVLFKSAEVAKSLVTQLEQMAAVTPFSTASIVQAATQLKIFGFSAKEIIPTLRTIGDAAALSPHGMEDGVARISYAIGEMRTHGRLLGTEMRQLVQAGVPAWELLSKQLGKSTAEIRAMMKKGALTSDIGVPALLAGMKDMFGGGMEKQAKTWIGLLSTLKDNLGIFLRTAGQPLFDVSKMGLQSLVEWFNTDQAQRWTQSISTGISYIIGLVRSAAASPMVGTLGEILGLISEIGGNLLRNLVGAFQYIDGAFHRYLGKGVGEVLAELGQKMLTWIRDVLDFVSLMTTNLSLTWDLLAEGAGLAWIKIKDSAASTFDTIKALGLGMYEALKAGAFAFLANFTAAFTQMKTVAEAVFLGLHNAWLAVMAGTDPSKAFGEMFIATVMKNPVAGPDIGNAMKDAFAGGFMNGLDPAKHQEDPAADAARRRMLGIVGQMEEERDKNRAAGDEALKNKEKLAALPDDGAPMGGKMPGKGSRNAFEGLAEYAKKLQSDLLGEDEATAAAKKAEAHLKNIADNGVKIKNLPKAEPAKAV